MDNKAILTINTKALADNYNYIKSVVGRADIAVMLKANAYGIGYKEVFDTVYEQGARNFFTAYFSEAISLKEYAKKDDIDIYILQDLNEENYSKFIENDFIPVLNTVSNIKLWSEVSKSRCVIHFDSGINRLGLKKDDVITLSKEGMFENLNIDYVMSHFAESEVENSEYTKWQFNNFMEVLPLFPKFVKVSLSNSSGALNNEGFWFDMVRVGASLYGINPTPNRSTQIKRVISLKARIIQIKNLEKGEKVGYNGNYIAPSDRVIALIGEGHADTILRCYANKGFVYFNKNKLPIIGNVSMDLTAIDITEICDIIKEGDYVEVIGDNQSLTDFASYGNTIDYEILTLLSSRYVKETK